MQNDFESKFYKELAEIKSIKEKIKKLRSDYSKLATKIEARDAVAAEQKEVAIKLIAEILRTQRFLADFMVSAEAQLLRIFIDPSYIENKSNVINQLVADTTRAKAEIRTSKDPLAVAAKFSKEWENNMNKLGFSFTRI